MSKTAIRVKIGNQIKHKRLINDKDKMILFK